MRIHHWHLRKCAGTEIRNMFKLHSRTTERLHSYAELHYSWQGACATCEARKPPHTALTHHKRDRPPPSGRILAQGHQRTSAPLPCNVRPSTLRRAARAVEPVAERRGSLHS